MSIAVLATIGVMGLALNPTRVSGDEVKPVTVVTPAPLPITGTVSVGNLGSTTLPMNDSTPPHGCHMDLSGYFIT